MDVRPRSPLEPPLRWESRPIRHYLLDADDVHEVSGEGTVWIAGHDPSVIGPNVERRWPPDVDPVH